MLKLFDAVYLQWKTLAEMFYQYECNVHVPIWILSCSSYCSQVVYNRIIHYDITSYNISVPITIVLNIFLTLITSMYRV